MEEMDILDILKSRAQQREVMAEKLRVGNMSTGKMGSNFLLGIGAGFSDALTGNRDTPEKVLAVNNREESARLAALENLGKDDGVSELLNLYRINQSDKLARDLQQMRDQTAMKKDEGVERRFYTGLSAADRKLDKTLDAQARMFEAKSEKEDKKDITKTIDGAMQDLVKRGFKFADSKASTASNKSALEKIRSAREATPFKGPIMGNVGMAMARIGVESPEFATFNRLIKDTVSQLIKERSGVAASEPEMKRLEATLPKITQRNDTFEAVLQDVIQASDEIIEDRKKEYNKVSLDAVASVVPDEETRQKAIDAIERGANPIDVLSRIKSQYRR